VGEWQSYTWPAVMEGTHKTMNCCQWAKEEVGTAPFPIAKEHLKLKV
jgi:hypothetical protein